MARRRPSTLDGFRRAKGVGEKKLTDHGPAFVERIEAYCRANGVPMDAASESAVNAGKSPEHAKPVLTPSAWQALQLFRQGYSVQQVEQQMDRATSTVHRYLAQFIRHEKITDPAPWVDSATVERVTQAAREVGTQRLKPIFELLEGQVSYSQIRLVVLCRSHAGESDPS